jgi:hypothetical protein
VKEKAVAEHHILPNVNTLLESFAELLAAVVLDEVRIEEPLGDPDEI